MKKLRWAKVNEQDGIVMDLIPRECSDCKDVTRFDENLEAADEQYLSSEDMKSKPVSRLSGKRLAGLMRFGGEKRECLFDDARLYPA